MRRVVMMGAVVALVMGTVSRAEAQTIRMTATLTGSNEAPTKVTTGSFGNATVTVDMSTNTVSWAIDVFNLPTGINNAHFHAGGTDTAGPVAVNIPFTANLSNDFSLTGSATALTAPRPDQGVRSWDDFIQSLLGGQVYINIHTTANPGGEIRGQVVRVP